MNNKYKLLNQIAGTLLKNGTKLSLNNLRYLARIDPPELIALLDKKDLEPVVVLKHLSDICISAQREYSREQLWNKNLFKGNDFSDFMETIPQKILPSETSSAFCSEINIPLKKDELFEIFGGIDSLVHSTLTLAQVMAIAQKNTARTPHEKITMDFERYNYFLITNTKNLPTLVSLYSKKEGSRHRKWEAFFVKEKFTIYRGKLFLKNN